MYRIVHKPNYDLPDVADFVSLISGDPTGFFGGDREISIARAPGRLDVMGGIADYSGSNVLEMPVAEAVCAAVQKRGDSKIKILSLCGTEELSFEMPLDDFFENGSPVPYDTARRYFLKTDSEHWAAYIAGVFHVLMRERNFRFEKGANILISSTIPQGKGVSSSAALEAAVMTAVAVAFDISLEMRESAILCQKVENLVVGAPCGIMDQMSVICGRTDELMSMVCQPAELQEPVKIPDELAFWGIDSGIRHAVVGADYGAVRTGAFMGYRIIAALAGLEVSHSPTLRIVDSFWNGFLANITPEEFEERFEKVLPVEIKGADFLARYGGTTDTITEVLPEKTYAVLKPTAHPVFENARVKMFGELLKQPVSDVASAQLGELMFSAHHSYSDCGLGSRGTDLIVELVRKKLAHGKLFGAKITGGGSGGTVVILGRRYADAAISEIVEEYEAKTNYRPYVFRGSSPGAAEFGHLKILRNQ